MCGSWADVLKRGFLLSLGLAGAFLAHWGHVRADDVRWSQASQERAEFLPSGETLEWFSMGFDTQIADWMWLKTVLVFGELDPNDVDPLVQDWLERSLNVSIHLDPEWHSLYSYGGLMLKVVGDIDASSRLLRKAVERFPDEHYFPFSLAANHFLQADQASALELETGVELALAAVLQKAGVYRGVLGASLNAGVRDRSSLLMAIAWMRHAAVLDGAPNWYAGAAESFLAQRSSIEVSIRFLSEQLKNETDEKLIESLTAQLNKYLHTFHSDALTELLESVGRDVGAEGALQVLVERRLIQRIPVDPYGEGWVVDVDGVVRSRWAIARIEKRALSSERQMLMVGGS